VVDPAIIERSYISN